MTYNEKSLSELRYDKDYNLVAINPGTYRFDVTVTDDNNELLKVSDAVTFLILLPVLLYPVRL